MSVFAKGVEFVKYEDTKQISEREKILLFEDSKPVVKLSVAWAHVRRHGACKGWGSCDFSFDEWCELAGIPPSQYNILQCERLINLNMVFPDGRVHYWMEKFINTRVGGAK